MAEFVEGENVSEAWVKASQRLRERGRRISNLAVVIKNPQVENAEIRRLVDGYFDASTSVRVGSVDAVADTMMPGSRRICPAVIRVPESCCPVAYHRRSDFSRA